MGTIKTSFFCHIKFASLHKSLCPTVSARQGLLLFLPLNKTYSVIEFAAAYWTKESAEQKNKWTDQRSRQVKIHSDK